MLLEGSVDTTQHKGATQTAEVGLQCCWKVLWTRRSIREQHKRQRWVYNVVGRFCGQHKHIV